MIGSSSELSLVPLLGHYGEERMANKRYGRKGAGMAVDWNRVSACIDRAERQSNVVGVALIGPGGSRFGHRADQRFRSASTIKILIMAETFRQMEAGERSLDDAWTLTAGRKANGSGVLQEMSDGLELRLRDLLYLMISISDNTATNALIDLAGLGRIQASMRELGMVGSLLGRKMLGRASKGDEPENWGVPSEFAHVVDRMVQGELVSESASRDMRALMEKQDNPRRIGRFVDDRDGFTWGSKTGSLRGVVNDVGYVTTSRGTLVASVFCEGEDLAVSDGEAIIGEIVRAGLQDCGLAQGA